MFDFVGLYLDKKRCQANANVLIVGLKDQKFNLKIMADKIVKVPFKCVGDYVNVAKGKDVKGNCSISYDITFATYATSIVISTSLDDKVDINSLDTKVSYDVAHFKPNNSKFLNF